MKKDKAAPCAVDGAEMQDPALLDALARRYGASLEKYFSRRVPSGQDVDDLVQDVFMRLARRANIASIPNIEGYLFQTAGSVLKDRARRHAYRQTRAHDSIDGDGGLVSAEASPERVLVGKQSISVVEAALMELPERTRDVFVLRHFEEMSVKEICKAVGLSSRAVHYKLAEALNHLSKALDDQ